MGAPKGGKGEWGLCLWATLPNSELASAAESPTAPELSPRPRQDSLQRRSAAAHRARVAWAARVQPRARWRGRAESRLCPASAQPGLNFPLAGSKRNQGDLGLVQASFLCSPRPQMGRGTAAAPDCRPGLQCFGAGLGRDGF